jgi:hypothetical protein
MKQLSLSGRVMAVADVPVSEESGTLKEAGLMVEMAAMGVMSY